MVPASKNDGKYRRFSQKMKRKRTMSRGKATARNEGETALTRESPPGEELDDEEERHDGEHDDRPVGDGQGQGEPDEGAGARKEG